MPATQLYMLAIMPPAELSREIDEIRDQFAASYDCKAALRVPVHITLQPPFRLTDDQAHELAARLSDWAVGQTPFPLTLEGFNFFRHNGVVFIDVRRQDLLSLFQQELFRMLRQWLPGLELKEQRPYHPHLTIAYRDIPKHLFAQAEAAYKSREFFSVFVVNELHLWRHDGSHWQVFQSMPMGQLGY